MGAFLSGLLGAAGADIENKEQRAYAEGLSERQQKRKMVEYAMQQAVQAGDYADMPYIMGQLDEIGVPSNAPKGVKDPFREMGTKLAQIFKRQKAQQGQTPQGQQPQQGQPQPPPGYVGTPMAPGQFAQPNIPQSAAITPSQPTPPALGTNMGFPPQTQPLPPTRFGQPSQMTAPLPPRRETRSWGDVGQNVQQIKLSEKEREAKIGREKFEFEENLLHKDRLEEIQEQAKARGDKALGGAVTVTGEDGKPHRMREFQRMDGTRYFEDLGIATTPEHATAAHDELVKWSKILMAKNPKLTPEQATQLAAEELVKNKFILPEQRLELQRNAVRTIVGEQGVLVAPSHVPGAMSRGVTAQDFPTQTPTPALPPSRVGTGQPAPAATPSTTGKRFQPKLLGTEVTRKENAEVIMTQGAQAIATIQQMSREHPDWFGPVAMRWQEIQKRFGTMDPRIGQLKGVMEGLIGFLPSLHGFRSGAILAAWKETLDNPLKNPQATATTIREVGKAAQELRDSILRHSSEPMTMEGEEKKATQGGPPPTKLNPYR